MNPELMAMFKRGEVVPYDKYLAHVVRADVSVGPDKRIMKADMVYVSGPGTHFEKTCTDGGPSVCHVAASLTAWTKPTNSLRTCTGRSLILASVTKL